MENKLSLPFITHPSKLLASTKNCSVGPGPFALAFE